MRGLFTRRMLLRDMGKGGVAVLVLGAAACSGEPTDNATPSIDPTATSSGSTPPSTAAPHPASTSATGSTAGGPRTGHGWHRVDLGFVSAYILYRGGEAAVVDTGVSGSEAAIETALSEVGLSWSSVGHLIVTHKHPDHQGSVEAVLAATRAPWYAGAGDIAEITATSEGSVVRTGDTIFDLQVIETPGHTPGHIAVLDETAGVLVAGDALNGANGGVAGPNPDFSEDMDAANASVQMLASFDYETILFGHGEPVLEGGRNAVADLASG